MKLTDYLLAELERETKRSRAVLAEVPAGQYEWKPHEKSMNLGYLADMVATIPTWIVMQVQQDELDIAPVDGARPERQTYDGGAALVQALDQTLAAARAALSATSDDHLQTNWRLKARGAVAQEAPRYEMIQDTFNHWAHHRGQLTVYLRLLGEKVAATYGPSADEQAFR